MGEFQADGRDWEFEKINGDKEIAIWTMSGEEISHTITYNGFYREYICGCDKYDSLGRCSHVKAMIENGYLPDVYA